MCYENAPTSLWISMSSLCIKHLEVDTTMHLNHTFSGQYSLLTARKHFMPITRSDPSLALRGMTGSCLWPSRGYFIKMCSVWGFTLGQPFTIIVQQLVSSFSLSILLAGSFLNWIYFPLSSLTFFLPHPHSCFQFLFLCPYPWYPYFSLIFLL